MQVTFIEALDNLMPGFDKEIARTAQRLLITGRPIDYHTGVIATKVTPGVPGALPPRAPAFRRRRCLGFILEPSRPPAAPPALVAACLAAPYGFCAARAFSLVSPSQRRSPPPQNPKPP